MECLIRSSIHGHILLVIRRVKTSRLWVVPRARITTCKDDGDSHCGKFGKVVVHVIHVAFLATDLSKDALPAIRNRVHEWRLRCGDDRASPICKVTTEILTLPIPKLCEQT